MGVSSKHALALVHHGGGTTNGAPWRSLPTSRRALLDRVRHPLSRREPRLLRVRLVLREGIAVGRVGQQTVVGERVRRKAIMSAFSCSVITNPLSCAFLFGFRLPSPALGPSSINRPPRA